MPTNFWDDFHPDLIKQDLNDQGPWGGHRATHWVALESNTFSTDEILSFAKANDWTFIDSLPYEANTASTKSFLLNYSGLDTTRSQSGQEYFPLWIRSKATLLQFKTNWMTVDPGTAESYDAFGYVVIDPARKEMVVYHLWGE